MAKYRFECPHCRGHFEIDDPAPAADVGCPNCGQRVTLPGELPPPPHDGEPAEPLVGESTRKPYIPFDFQASEVAASSGRPSAARRREKPPAASLSRQQTRRRQRTRSLIAMLFGMTVLVVAVILLSRWSQR